MTTRSFKYVIGVLLMAFMVSTSSSAYDGIVERQIMVSMRDIGHKVLLSVGDTTSRVMPILKVEDRYKLSFASGFSINPEEMVVTIEEVVKKTNMAKSYLVEVEDDKNGEVVYSYRIGETIDIEAVSCKTRDLPFGNYNIYVTILELGSSLGPLTANKDEAAESISSGSKGDSRSMWVLLIIPVSLLIAWSLRIRKKKQGPVMGSQAVNIGEYQFDKRNMELSIQDQRTELTSKEADLLDLLHSRANNTIERDEMLREVWGDEGDYVGRTLDVFISKLRKKLEADPSIRIANIRGVGYKLILNN